MNARVSLIITNYNYGRYVAGAIDGLLAQTFRELEVVVIDDLSTDGSREILERYRSEPRVRLVLHQNNRGHIPSYNEGIALARGDLIGLFDADDLCLRPDAVARQVAVFDANPDVGLVYASQTYMDERGVPFREFKPWAADYVRDGLLEFGDLAFRNYIAHTGTLIRRSAHDRLGVYDLDLPHSGDWELWLRIATTFKIGYIAEPLYGYRLHGGNMSVSKHSPGWANQQNVRAIEKAFDALPADAPAALRRQRRSAVEHVLLATQWGDRGLGRVRRSWLGLVDAAWRAPRLLTRPMFYGALARTAILTIVGYPRYQRLSRLRGARPMGGAATTGAPAGRG